MTSTLCFVAQDKPFLQQRDALERVSHAFAADVQLGPRSEPLRPPHTFDTLADDFELGIDARRLVPEVLRDYAIFRPYAWADKLFAFRRGQYLTAAGEASARAFVLAYLNVYPWGRVGLWHATLGPVARNAARR